MTAERITVRGTESMLLAFREDLTAFLESQHIAAGQIVDSEPAPVRRTLTDRPPLGHELWMQLVIEIGKAVAVGVLSGVAKDLIVAWVKEQAQKRGLIVESKGDTAEVGCNSASRRPCVRAA